jgi:hypothetical protein
VKKAEVRYYFDADVLGLAHVVCGLRPDCTYPGDPGRTIKRQVRSPCLITQGAKDREWIPVVADQGWVAITRDADIQSHLSLLQLVRDYGLRLITLSSADARGPWEQLEVVASNWRRIEEIYERAGPLVLSATRTALRHINIDEAIEKIRDGRAVLPRRSRRRDEGQTLF